MGVDGSVTGGTGEVLVLTVGDVEVSLRVTVLLGETKVDDVDLVSTLANTHKEVVRLDIAVDEVAGVNVLDTRNQLVGEEKHSLEAELAVTEVEQVFEGRAKKVENHGIVVALGSVPADEGDTNATGKRLVDLGLVLELGVLGLDRLKLDGDFLARDNVDTKVNVT
jgi:hypothetical protein